MSHMVIYRSADGKPKFQQVDDLQAAVTFVEKLRNEDGIEGSKIFRLEQVNYRFEPYYQVKVEVADQSPASVPPPPPVASATAPQAAVAAPAQAPAPAAPVVDLTTSAAAAPAGATTGAAEPTPAPSEAPAAATTTEDSETNGVRRGLFGR